MPELSYLSHIELDETGPPAPTPEGEPECRMPTFELLEETVFGLAAQDGRHAP